MDALSYRISIGSKSFYGCTQLVNISFVKGCSLSSIGTDAFYGCTSLTNYTIPDSFVNITYLLFGSAPSIKTVNIPSNMSIVCIGSKAFDTFPLEFFNIGTGTTISYIDDYAFANKKIHSFILECDVCVSSYAFTNCTNLETINITKMKSNETFSKASVSSVLSARKVLSSNEDVYYTLPEGIFDGCTSLKVTNINMNIYNISSYAFRNCVALSFSIPSSVTYIGDYSFDNCKLVNNIPKMVTFFGNYSFRGSGIGRTMKLNTNTTFIGFSSFFNTSLIVVYYCGDKDFSSFSNSFDTSTSVVVTFDYPSSTFCGANAYHMQSNTCSDIMQTNNDVAGIIKKQMKNNLQAEASLLISSPYLLGLW
ncbi:hypothetical protein TVAG_194350 [Trichomonas vaginalis G3]|uniref:Surface antigen BspA-like n=1 Tax=Trichomonas vaginalis (strain ATCC PRA-98 / G3) TaxID=412133 RepID=A2ESA6_TRIV3|nr:leucine-rich repeats (6 copies)-containing protein [Trichomonas vaginalis G3]EAY04470.1 hypothetical protein TVAG_194350 [Trichomonas vaginalis G3]KAI5510255.1 leucine-rich repeats (6 copies)-containing protein [Trichomonas vaginalis G3]|eukprot:XP_001316693.1 hypothetical protein [Trichomonas vaginalis G3]